MSVSRLETEEELAEGGMETRRTRALKGVDKDPSVSVGCEHGVEERKGEIAIGGAVESRPDTIDAQELDMAGVEKRSR